jgi:hypothetical protein
VIIQLQQSGGFAAVRRPPVTIDTSSLPAADADRWHRLVADAGFFDLPASADPGPARDAFAYQVTVEEGGRRHSVRTTDAAVPPALRPLLDQLRQAGRH